MSDPTPPPAGWYPEPSGAQGQRWWDGTRWTEYASPIAPPQAPAVVAAVAPVVAPVAASIAPVPTVVAPVATVAPVTPAYAPAYTSAPAYAAAQPAPYGQPAVALDRSTPVDTVWLWVIIGMPLLMLLPLYLLDWRSYAEASVAAQASLDLRDDLGVYSDPWYLSVSLSGFIVYGLSVWFAYLDRSRLLRRGFVRPFHWAWAFLSPIVYVIGRAVVVKRQAGRGGAAIWAMIAVIAVVIVATTIFYVNFFMLAFELMMEAGVY